MGGLGVGIRCKQLAGGTIEDRDRGIVSKRYEQALPLGDEPARDRTVLVHGHTHKPYMRNGVRIGTFGRMTLANTGGWVVESKKISKDDPRKPGLVLGTDAGDVFLLTFNSGHDVQFKCVGTDSKASRAIQSRFSHRGMELGKAVVEAMRVREKNLAERLKGLEGRLDRN